MEIETPSYWVAVGAHGAQPYADGTHVDVHLRAVVEILVSFNFCAQFWIDAGWLHDTDEDTAFKVAQTRLRFGDMTADLVWAVTGVGDNRRERNASIYEKIAAFPRAAILKTADRIANLRSSKVHAPSLFRMYQKEASTFVPAVRDHIPEEMLAALMEAHQ
jgi:(p)ppGpp synthase/HD superfamily hydrolase